MNAFEELKEIRHRSDNTRKQLSELLENPLIRWDILELYAYYQECRRDKNTPEWYLQALSFLLFSVSVEIEPSDIFLDIDEKDIIRNKAIEIRREVIEDDMMLLYNFILDDYNIAVIKEKKPIKFSFHKSGTTSYIFKLQYKGEYGDNELALKIPKYRYKKNRTINEETASYQNKYAEKDYMPHIHASDQTFILMDFITGDTLLEFIQKRINPETNELKRFQLTYFIIHKLTEALLHFSRQKAIIHKDLNPNNILINGYHEEEEPKCDLFLIDFGTNYLLNENIGSSQSLDKVAAYIPNEVLSDSDNASIMSDIYSLGVLILRALTRIDKEEDFEKRRFEDFRDEIRLDFPLLSPVLEDIMDEDPDMRLSQMQREIIQNKKINIIKPFSNIKKLNKKTRDKLTIDFSDLYERINKIMLIELNVLKKSKKKDLVLKIHELASSFLSGQYLAILLNLKTPKAQHYIEEMVEKDQGSYQAQTKRLFHWEIAAEISNYAVWIGFLFVIAVFLGYNPPFDFRNIDFNDFLASIVLLSFSIIAVNYYRNIFSSLSTGNFKGFWPFLTNIWLRFCTFYWPIPILVAFYKGGAWWAYVAALGTFIVAVNNGLNYIVAKKAVTAIGEADLSQIIKDRLKDFKEWWKLMLAYSAFILIIGLLLEKGILKDERAYLIIIMIANIKMFTINCTDWALNVTKTLKYLYSRYDRILKHNHSV